MSKQITVVGIIRQIKYRSPENWSVFSLEVIPTKSTEDPENKEDQKDKDPFSSSIPNIPNFINVTGNIQEMTDVGDKVTITGSMEIGKYGEQLAGKTIIPESPDTNSDEGVLKLLCRLPGIGPVKAKKAIKDFGHEKAWKHAIEDPMKIGVRKDKEVEAKEKANLLVANFESLIFLLGIGLTDNQTSKVIKKYGSQAVMVVSENPYILIKDIDGFGFAIVDTIALKAGIAIDSQARIMAAVEFVLDSSENEGNTYFNGKVLVAKALEFMEVSAMKNNVPLIRCPGYEDVRNALYKMRDSGIVKIGGGNIFSCRLLNAEKVIFDAVNGTGEDKDDHFR